jgi:hypothetical protein
MTSDFALSVGGPTLDLADRRRLGMFRSNHGLIVAVEDRAAVDQLTGE